MMGFISFPAAAHNGHTIVAAILATHPHISIANSYSKSLQSQEIIKLAKTERWDARYSFEIPGQHVEKIDIKMVGFSGSDPDNVEKLPHYPIFILRNPFDVIGSRYTKFKNRQKNPLNYASEDYFIRMKEAFQNNFFTVIHEEFIQNPYKELLQILNYLNLEAPSSQWVLDVCKYVDPVPFLSRQRTTWTSFEINRVFGFLNDYADFFQLDKTKYHETEL